jgi:pilus assembly protein CpaE
VGIVSAKGGCGSSTIACHSAVALGARAAKDGGRALLMDLDLNTGVDRFILKAPGEYSVVDAVKNFQKLDISYWNSLVSKSHTGLDVLAAPTKLRSDQEFKLDEVQYVLSFARRYYKRVVLDLGRGVGQIATAILPQLSELYVIATNEIIPLYMTQQMLQAIDAIGYPRERVRLIFNRLPRTGRGEIRDLEKALGIAVTYSLPNDYEALRECYSSGKLLPEASAMAKGIRSLVGLMMGEPVQEQPKTMKRFLQKFADNGVMDRSFTADQAKSSTTA